jgi:hypothetical protein
MSEVDVDGAYEWLVVIVGIVFGIMSSYPEFFWGGTEVASASLTAVRSVVIPLVASAVLWLTGKLIINPNRKLLVKSVAWMFSVAVTGAVFITYLIGARFLLIQSERMQAILSYSVLFGLSPLFTFGIVLPRYREKYPDATFFKNRVWLIFALVIFVALILGMIYFSAQV